MSPEGEARLARAIVRRRGTAPLRAICPGSLAIVCCDGSPGLYQEPLSTSARRDRIQAWAFVREVHAARREMLAAEAAEAAKEGDAA